jgi:hypothetical protein
LTPKSVIAILPLLSNLTSRKGHRVSRRVGDAMSLVFFAGTGRMRVPFP